MSTTLLSDIDIVPSSDVLGAEVRGVDIAEGIDDATLARIKSAWSERLGTLAGRGVIGIDLERTLEGTLVLFTELAPGKELLEGPRDIDASRCDRVYTFAGEGRGSQIRVVQDLAEDG